MSEHGSEGSDDTGLNVPDEDLPDDVRPSEDNPLAQPAGDEVPDDILKDTSGKRPMEERDEDEPQDQDQTQDQSQDQNQGDGES
jgi:hypothetical protein